MDAAAARRVRSPKGGTPGNWAENPRIPFPLFFFLKGDAMGNRSGWIVGAAVEHVRTGRRGTIYGNPHSSAGKPDLVLVKYGNDSRPLLVAKDELKMVSK